nr:helix-turn-helix domain-containing protein [Neisseria meningitidis]
MKHDCTNGKPKTPNQRQRILARLRQGSVTSWELFQMGILGYNTRIMELRQAGHNIVTTMEEIQKIWRNREARAVFAGVGGQAIIARQSS